MNVQEVIKISKERKHKNKELIKKVVENIHKKIKYYATMKKESCMYTIPPIVDEVILYDFQNAVKDIFKILDSEGYIVTAYPSGQLDICWNESLVEQKIKTDKYILSTYENGLKNLRKKNKQIDERFGLLANPKKVEKKFDTIIDEQINKILREKDRKQKKFADLLNK